MITVTAFKWVPPFAQGQVRDYRVRRVLREVGWPYQVRLLDADDQASAAYRAQQPFGQVPVLAEDGRPALFESGAIVLDVAMRSGRLIGSGEVERGQVFCWVIGALNSVEPALMNVAEVAYFTDDEEVKTRRRPVVEAFARERLAGTEAALGERTWLVGEAFSVADLMLSAVLKGATSLGLISDFPKLAAHQERCFARSAYRQAIEEQCAAFAEHGPADMKYPQPPQ